MAAGAITMGSTVSVMYWKTVKKKLLLTVLTLFILQMQQCLAYGSVGEESGGTSDVDRSQPPLDCIDWIDGDKLVIGDTEYLKTRETLYYDSKGKRTGVVNRFQVGSCVRVVADGEYRIVAIYAGVQSKKKGVDNDKEHTSASNQSPDCGGSGVWLENGVWKN